MVHNADVHDFPTGSAWGQVEKRRMGVAKKEELTSVGIGWTVTLCCFEIGVGVGGKWN